MPTFALLSTESYSAQRSVLVPGLLTSAKTLNAKIESVVASGVTCLKRW